MGNETSHRSGNTSEHSIPYIMNNVNPLKFHQVHGENIQLSKNDTVATREGGFCKAIAFSHRPVAVNEYIYIKFLDVQTGWSGALRIGFTSNDPNIYKNKLPKYSCPCMTDMPGNWARALSEHYAVTNSVLFYYVDVNGIVHYGFDQEERGIFFGGINTEGKLWAMLDIYGNTVKIEFLDPHQIQKSRIPGQVGMIPEQNAITPVRSSGSSADATKSLNLSHINFHKTCGQDVFVHGNRAALKKSSETNGCGYVFLDRSIDVNECIVLKILSCSKDAQTGMTIGVTSCCPSVLSIEEFPSDPDDLLDRSEYWVVQKCNQILQPSDILTFFVEPDGALKYSLNGGELSVVCYVDPLAKLWFFLILGGSVLEVQVEGVHQKSDVENIIPLLYALCISNSQCQEESSGKCPKKSAANECVICCEKNANSALYRCGHVCMCYECALQVKAKGTQCPLCREVIVDVIQIFT